MMSTSALIITPAFFLKAGSTMVDTGRRRVNHQLEER